MDRPRFRGVVSLVLFVVVLVAPAVSWAKVDWPTRWAVNGNGATGTLEFSINEDGALTGTLLGEAVEGFVSGRHLVIRRVISGRTEVWDAWLSDPAEASTDPILAGTVTIATEASAQVYPWFGTFGVAASAAMVPTAAGSAMEIAAAPGPTPESAPGSSSPQGPFVGYWTAKEGRIEVRQDGKTLTVIMPDGSELSGRETGTDALIIGIRTGCCNGRLSGPDAIDWSDGSRWQRAD